MLIGVSSYLHGKAGVIELADGKKLGFIGSMNETRSGWQRHYEILWEDESTEGIAWIEEEFNFLWNAAKELPRAVIREVRRRGYRREVVFDEINEDTDLVPRCADRVTALPGRPVATALATGFHYRVHSSLSESRHRAPVAGG